MTEKHLGFAAVRSSFGNRKPRTIEIVREPYFTVSAVKPDTQLFDEIL